MKIFIGILGYVLLITGAIFINAPIIALLAIPVYLVGIALIIIFYIGLLDKQKPHVKIYSALIIFGIILGAYFLAATVIQYTYYLTEVDRAVFMNVPQDGSHNIVKLPLKDLIINGLLNLLISIVITFSIIKGSQIDKESAGLICLPLFLVIPITLFLVKFLTKSGFPILGG